MKRKNLTALLILVLALTGCSVAQNNENQVDIEPDEPIYEVQEQNSNDEGKHKIEPLAEVIVKEITADKYTGRLVGTEGNQLATEYLAEQFEANGLLPMNDEGYLQKYLQDVANPEEQEPQVSILMKDGTVLDLVLGTDYVCSIVSEDLDLDVPIVIDPEEDADLPGACVIIFEGGVKSRIPCDAMVTVDDGFFFSPAIKSVNNRSCKIRIQITQAVYDKMESDEAERIQVRAKNVRRQAEVNNVVGMVPGLDNTDRKAVVLTAHFDHCGKQGESIYNGALDNASGVAMMLDVARYVKETVGDNEFDFDLVVAAVNSEEVWIDPIGNCVGSQKLAEGLKDQYSQIYNINFDCVGGKEAGRLALGNFDVLSEPLAESLKNHFNRTKVAWVDDNYTDFADHGSFRAEGFSAMTVGQEGYGPYAHKPTDTYEKLDYENIDMISKSVSDFIVQEGQELFAKLAEKKDGMSGPEYVEWCEASKAELKKQLAGRELAFDEKYQFVYDGFLTIGTGYHPFTGVDEMLKYYPDLNISEEISDFMISMIDICNYEQLGDICWSTRKDYALDQLGKVNKITLNKNEIVDVKVEYYNKDRDEYLSIALYPNGMKGSLKVDPVEGMKDVYLLKCEWEETDEYEGFIYKNQGWTAEIKTYHKRYDESSDNYWPDWNTMQKSKDEVLNLIKTIEIEKIADALIQNLTA
jgi:hypothetical protein